MKHRSRLSAFLLLICIGLAALSGCGRGKSREKEAGGPPAITGEEEAHELVPIEVVPEETIPEPEPLPQYEEILKINPYVSGWLKIDDTVIDDPVVYTPQDQNFFLHKAIDGTDEEKGTLFIAVNWGDIMNQTLIYGHNMKDGTAFGSLQKFADEAYGLKHHIIHFDTLYEKRDYELYGVFFSQIAVEDLETDEDRAEREQAVEDASMDRLEDEGREVSEEDLTLDDLELYGEYVDEDIYRMEKDEDNGRFRYYYYTDLKDKDDFEYFAKSVKERALYDTGVEAEWGDEFITLSTCSYQVKNGRFVVVGIRRNHFAKQQEGAVP